MPAVKIVVTGAHGAGKSHFIRTISEIDALRTDYAVPPEAVREETSPTTVALDYGTLNVNEEVTLYLFGAPGQERFDFIWEHLTVGCLGYVVLVDSTQPARFAETRRLLARFAELTDAPFVVAANKQDHPAALPPETVARCLCLDPAVVVLPCAGLDKDSVKEVLLALLRRIVTGPAKEVGEGVDAS